ncbi:hypothetical protein [Marinobacterium litorale]|uniref:hypothetical protein n=1 Tax=Marinobacterium litorale TaxID=404770 RepID=UPI00042878CA|nr:hypothetical protein [Marinobacterium litorale]
MDITAGRGQNGITADLDILPVAAIAEVPPASAKRSVTMSVASAPVKGEKAEPVTEEVAAEAEADTDKETAEEAAAPETGEQSEKKSLFA